MPSDRSRSTDRPRHGYTAPVAQQGRVILDRDFNALQGLTASRIAADALDIIGPCGTPDDGFRISLANTSSPGPPFWSPPASPPASPPQALGTDGDFLIAPGTMYLGGERVMLPSLQHDNAITYSYFDQPDWPAPPPASFQNQRELAYLDVTEQDVSAVEDLDLLEVALGGPDTTQRLKLLRRVKRQTVSASDCSTAWDNAISAWSAEGLEFDPTTMRLSPAARLQVGFTQQASSGDPCDPVATGGYLYADNQLIRVRIAASGSTRSLVWGYDNASFLYRITAVSADRTTLTLAGGPPDAFHVPQTGQVVEILTTASVLGSEPDETDPSGRASILRVAAEANGELHQLAQPYGPVTQGDPTNHIVLTQALTPAVANSPLPLFLRVWQAELPLDTSGAPVTLADPTTGISTGITVTLSGARVLADGAFWQIAARPATPQGVYPEDLLTAPQPPDGPRRWVCPLAVIDWSAQGGATVTDCRTVFDDLITLSRRKPGCCTVAIGPADVTATTTLQTLIDRAAAKAKTVTVCLSAGSYILPAPLRLDARHAGMTLESCGGTALFTAAKPAPFGDGLLVLTNVDAITLRGLTLNPPQVAISATLLNTMLRLLPESEQAEAKSLLTQPYASFGVRALNAAALTLDGCAIHFLEQQIDTTADLLAAAVFLQGNCAGLTVKNCAFDATITPTYTPLAVQTDTAAPAAALAFNTAISRLAVEVSSPPSDNSNILVSQALDAVVANRRAENFTLRNRAVIATAGIVANNYSSADSAAANFAAAVATTLACTLGATLLRDNRFAQLSFAAASIASMTALRLQDNTVSAGVAGFWFLVPGANALPAPPEAINKYYQTVRNFEEYMLLFVLSSIYPPPKDRLAQPSTGTTTTITTSIALVSAQTAKTAQPATPAPAALDTNVRLAAAQPAAPAQPVTPAPAALAAGLSLAPGVAATTAQSVTLASNTLATNGGSVAVQTATKMQTITLFVRGNDVQTGIPQSSVPGSAALLLWLNPLPAAVEGQTSELSLIVSANHLLNISAATATGAPTALLVLPAAQPCAIVGNIVLNQSANEKNAGPSLWVVIAGASDAGQPLSIAGNVLSSPSDAQQFSHVMSRVGWSSYNADPS